MKINVDTSRDFDYYEIKSMEVIQVQFLLESIRRANKESQENMAKLINVDVRTYQNKEKGVTQFKQNEMFIIARHFNKKIDEIFLPTNFEKQEVYSNTSDNKGA